MQNLRYLSIPPELLQAVLDNPNLGLVVIDHRGIIRHFSRGYESCLGISADDAVGRPMLDLFPSNRLSQVLGTGRAELGDVVAAKGRYLIVNRYPIEHKGTVIGAVGIVILEDPKVLIELQHRMREIESSLKKYQSGIQDLHRSRYSFEDIIGSSDKLCKAKQMAEKVAASESPVLLMGESGTGKELFAHAIHQASSRRGQPFIRINCASIPGELFESELFGYEAGAFTGATKSGKIGKFELAHKGTIFLDEIGELSFGSQAKLLRVLQEKEIEPLGARKPKLVDFRLVSATNRDLQDRVEDGYFRKDLFYRLNVVSINLPALRETKEDIPILAGRVLAKFRNRMSASVSEIAEDVLEIFLDYDWPGNTRELENVIERALSLCSDSRIAVTDLPEALLKAKGRRDAVLTGSTSELRPLHVAVVNAEKEQLLDALQKTGGNKSEAATLLNIHRTTLYYKLKKYGISAKYMCKDPTPEGPASI